MEQQQSYSPRTLQDLVPGQSGMILSVGNQSGAVKRRLVDMGLTPGTTVKVTKVAPLGDPLEVSLRGDELSLRKDDAAQIRIGAPRRPAAREAAAHRTDPERTRKQLQDHVHELEQHERPYDHSAHDSRPMRIALAGNPNCGKTTLLKMIMGEVQPDQGRIEIGETVNIGYYAQEAKDMDPGQRVIDYIKDTAEYIRTEDGYISASQMLEKFLFAGSLQYQMIGKLSGGEKRRLYLAKILMGAPNVLILDEPTNDLDISTLCILEDYLDTFPGILITVSHDRYFLDRVVDHMRVFEWAGKISLFNGSYQEYYETYGGESLTDPGEKDKTGQQTGEETANLSGAQAYKMQKEQSKKLKFTYNEQREYESIEDDIAGLEEALEKLDEDMAANATNSVKLGELLEEKKKVEQTLEEKMERWEHLEDLAAKIAAQ